MNLSAALHFLPTGPNDPQWLDNPALTKQLGPAVLDTLYMVLSSGILTVLLGLPLGLLLVSSSPTGMTPRPTLNRVVGLIVNVVRSFPFIILIIAIQPFTRLVVGTTLGWKAVVVPLTIGAVPFFARLVETNIASISPGKIEAAQMMGASHLRIQWGVQVREAMPQIVQSITVLLITLVGYSAMAGAVGGGGLGQMAINYGYVRYQNDVMLVTVVLIILIVQIIQMAGDMISRLVDHR